MTATGTGTLLVQLEQLRLRENTSRGFQSRSWSQMRKLRQHLLKIFTTWQVVLVTVATKGLLIFDQGRSPKHYWK